MSTRVEQVQGVLGSVGPHIGRRAGAGWWGSQVNKFEQVRSANMGDPPTDTTETLPSHKLHMRAVLRPLCEVCQN